MKPRELTKSVSKPSNIAIPFMSDENTKMALYCLWQPKRELLNMIQQSLEFFGLISVSPLGVTIMGFTTTSFTCSSTGATGSGMEVGVGSALALSCLLRFFPSGLLL